ncbi:MULTISPECIES: N-acetylmuramic acid 6-phosphate etherase [Pectobacterium]|uniref:N-acetylmuramic acid 6-phosphate etherase n=1 Tax=Pectobacterium punjabense TaxID=2108399 RepID=A0ABX6L4A1_9GAMM|nr:MULTISPECIES: N-acetylmuramic acid 6-phosphate etherase [Pectobacterium]GKW10880.1 N-acetylmuramic acid 6-phosphate etherase [Pectobacterium carotovorum subsp. carotovorum]MBS4429477.1 N-acetylmuramic acid 6-phosphate etherase [Pectobacterium punjabense]MBT9186465.1 N-acetylmuramic acid 6-phosphate etherase [Pectobacterium punjabense]MCE9732615.1 N-acetylmuramic acid 6-phosphate etherase [Pectobacterium sp. IFB5596]PTA62427.1 N-acetylmuramic acid 6-phosphate etherase [Pectobacterium punjabe
MKINLSQMMTESRNPASSQIDTLSTLEMLAVINAEDKKVSLAVEATLPDVAKVVDLVTEAFANGGRLIYCGAGTSGRLGILDASECPPTYGTPREQVIGLIAGGHTAILQAVENAEDNPEMGKQDLRNIEFNSRDVLVGIAASGRTPYVLGAMAYARHVGATVAAISCNQNSEMSKAADIAIEPVVGPEVVTGSSRMKAGTAQKLILNMITTSAMIRSGKVYSNLMVDVEATNAKLVQRQVNIVVEATECSPEEAESVLNECQRHCKTAIVMILGGLTAQQATAALSKNNGFIRKALQGIQV